MKFSAAPLFIMTGFFGQRIQAYDMANYIANSQGPKNIATSSETRPFADPTTIKGKPEPVPFKEMKEIQEVKESCDLVRDKFAMKMTGLFRKLKDEKKDVSDLLCNPTTRNNMFRAVADMHSKLVQNHGGEFSAACLEEVMPGLRSPEIIVRQQAIFSDPENCRAEVQAEVERFYEYDGRRLRGAGRELGLILGCFWDYCSFNWGCCCHWRPCHSNRWSQSCYRRRCTYCYWLYCL